MKTLTEYIKVHTKTRRAYIHLTPQVEALVKKKHGDVYLKDHQAGTELARINRELKRLKAQIAVLEERRSKLIAGSKK